MITDPDKIVAEAQKQRIADYQSAGQPRHYDNEGEEFMTAEPNHKSNVMENIEEDIEKNKILEGKAIDRYR